MSQTVLSDRKLPNIAFTGTPATGKSTLARRLAERFPVFKIFDVNSAAKTLGCRGKYDSSMKCYEVDEFKLADKVLESSEFEDGGNIIDWMHADFWLPDEDDIDEDFRPILDLVVTVRASNTALFDRYKERKYPNAKVQENLDAEIMGVIAEDNAAAFKDLSGVDLMELQNENQDDVEQNVRKVIEWVQLWREKKNASPLSVNDGDEGNED